MKGFRDRLLVRRALRGDRAAGEKLITEHYARIYRLLRHLTGNTEDAQHLTQQTFVNAWQALATFRGTSSLATWLHRIAYREYTRYLGSRRNDVSLDDVDVPDDSAGRALEAVALRQGLAQLSPEHRATFLLYHVQGLSVSEVATTLDVPEGTVKSRLFVARRLLREFLSIPKEVVPNDLPATQHGCQARR